MPPRRSDVRPPPKAGNPGAPAPKAVEPKGPPATKPKVGPPPAPVPKQPTIAAGTSRLAGVQAIVQGQSAQEFVFGAQVELINYNHHWTIADLCCSISAEIAAAPAKLTQLANHPLFFVSQTALCVDTRSKDMRSKDLAAGNVPDDPQYPGVSAARVAYAVAGPRVWSTVCVWADWISSNKFDNHRVYRLWACVYLLWCYRYLNTTAIRRSASGTYPSYSDSGVRLLVLQYFDPLVLEFLADLLTDPNAQPPPNWNTARACSWHSFWRRLFCSKSRSCQDLWHLCCSHLPILAECYSGQGHGFSD